MPSKIASVMRSLRESQTSARSYADDNWYRIPDSLHGAAGGCYERGDAAGSRCRRQATAGNRAPHRGGTGPSRSVNGEAPRRRRLLRRGSSARTQRARFRPTRLCSDRCSAIASAVKARRPWRSPRSHVCLICDDSQLAEGALVAHSTRRKDRTGRCGWLLPAPRGPRSWRGGPDLGASRLGHCARWLPGRSLPGPARDSFRRRPGE